MGAFENQDRLLISLAGLDSRSTAQMSANVNRAIQNAPQQAAMFQEMHSRGLELQSRLETEQLRRKDMSIRMNMLRETMDLQSRKLGLEGQKLQIEDMKAASDVKTKANEDLRKQLESYQASVNNSKREGDGNYYMMINKGGSITKQISPNNKALQEQYDRDQKAFDMKVSAGKRAQEELDYRKGKLDLDTRKQGFSEDIAQKDLKIKQDKYSLDKRKQRSGAILSVISEIRRLESIDKRKYKSSGQTPEEIAANMKAGGDGSVAKKGRKANPRIKKLEKALKGLAASFKEEFGESAYEAVVSSYHQSETNATLQAMQKAMIQIREKRGGNPLFDGGK